MRRKTTFPSKNILKNQQFSGSGMCPFSCLFPYPAGERKTPSSDLSHSNIYTPIPVCCNFLPSSNSYPVFSRPFCPFPCFLFPSLPSTLDHEYRLPLLSNFVCHHTGEIVSYTKMYRNREIVW